MKKKENTIIYNRVLNLEQLNTISAALNNNIVDLKEVKSDYIEWYCELLETERAINEIAAIIRNDYQVNITIEK